MEQWSFPLILATAAFLVVLLWRVRPLLPPLSPARSWRAWWRGGGRQGSSPAAPPGSRQSLRDAKARIEGAKSEPEKAIALCEAAELLTPARAEGFYLRAVRAAPASTEVIGRVVAGLGRRPRILESVLWRHLAASAWAETRLASLASLEALVGLYDGPLRDPTSARALRRAAELLRTPASSPTPSSTGRPEDLGQGVPVPER